MGLEVSAMAVAFAIMLGLLGLIGAMSLFARNYVKVPPSTVAIFYGRKHTITDERGQRATVAEYLAERHADERFVQEGRDVRGLNNPEGAPAKVDAWRARRQAIAVRIVDMIAGLTLGLDLRRPLRHLHIAGLQVLGKIEKEALGEARVPPVDRTFGGPDARQIRPSVGRPRSGRRWPAPGR